MYEGNIAHICMTRNILEQGYFDKNSYECKVITYKPEEEQIYLLTEKEELPVFSLDGLYECQLGEGEETVVCNGMITERYTSRQGKVLIFRIKNGFYKKVLN